MRYGRHVRNAIGFLAVLALILGPLLAHFAIVPPLAGFAIFALGGIVSIVVGLASLVQRARGRALTTGGALGLVAAIAFVGLASRGGGQPRINDFTTDLADPPAFRHATSLAPNAGRDMGYPADFAPVQRECAPTCTRRGCGGPGRGVRQGARRRPDHAVPDGRARGSRRTRDRSGVDERALPPPGRRRIRVRPRPTGVARRHALQVA
jgi:hypothetical protein